VTRTDWTTRSAAIALICERFQCRAFLDTEMMLERRLVGAGYRPAMEAGACYPRGPLSAPSAGDAPITCQPLFWDSGVKTAGRTLMSHSMFEDRLL